MGNKIPVTVLLTESELRELKDEQARLRQETGLSKASMSFVASRAMMRGLLGNKKP